MPRPFPRIAPLAAALLLATACGEDHVSTPEGDRLEHDGVSIELPHGWEGRVLSPAIIQAANFKFVPVGIELPTGKEDPIKAMTSEHALVMVLPCGLASWEDAARQALEQIGLDELTLLPAGHSRVPRGHAFSHGSFRFDDRCLRVEVDFGAAQPSPMLTKRVNEVLASLSVAES